MQPQIQDKQLFHIQEDSLENLHKIEQQIQNNKKQMYAILKKSPVVGIYDNEDEQLFYHEFLPFYISFIKSEFGPRGQCSKAVRQSMQKKPQFYDEILKPLSLKHNSHIRDIYTKYKIYIPSNQFVQLQKLQECLNKTRDAFQKISDSNSIMYASIKEGLLKKHGDQFDFIEQINTIRISYSEKLAKFEGQEKQLTDVLQADQRYIDYIKIKEHMTSYFEKWRAADIRIGMDSVSKGSNFEKKVKEQIMSVILKRSGLQIKQKQNVRILVNCRWVPKSIGEIDIAIAQFNTQLKQWEVTVLIECKSKFFDIREAYKQVAVLKTEAFSKEKLSTKLGILNVRQNPKYFIVTTLPENPFNLPIQSKLKQALEKSSKNKTIEEIQKNASEIYKSIRQRFKGQLSPLSWINANDSERVIVLRP